MSSDPAPPLAVDEAAPAAPRALSEAPALRAFLARQRWCRADEAALGGAEVVDVAPLGPRLWWAAVRLHGGGREALYSLPLALCDAAAVPQAAHVAAVARAAGPAVLADATQHPPSLAALAAALAEGHRWAGEAAAWEATPLAPWPPGAAAALGAGRPLRGEQSNACIAYGEHLLLKLYRRLEPGPNPDLEVCRYLGATGFAGVPACLGALRLQRGPAGAAWAEAGMLQALVPAAQDGFTWACEARRAGADFAAPAARLGGLTAALHAALARPPQPERWPDFGARPGGEAAVAGWVAATAAALGEATEALAAAAPHLEGAAARLADAVLARRAALGARLRQLAAQIGAAGGTCSRHHGDYHLGQVLRGGDGALRVIDFEGEPLRPLAARRARHSPARDVAGILRSLAYAAHVGGEHGAGGPAAAPAWEGRAAAALVAAYEAALRQAAPELLPPAPVQAALVALFTLEKALYEVRYELAHRPAWVAIPLAAVLALGTAAPPPVGAP